MVKAKAVKEYRSEAHASALVIIDGGYPPLYETAMVLFRWYHRTPHRIDPDNIIATMKSAIDGLNDAGVFDDDNKITYLPPEQFTDKDNPRIEIKVYG